MKDFFREYWDTVFVGLLLILVFTSALHTFTSINQDIGRHLRLGEEIWQTHHVPQINEFSYTAPDFPFINHHWLSEVILYLGMLAVGLRGLIVVKAIILTVAFGLAFFAAYRKEYFWTAMMSGVIAWAILLERTDVRPEIFSFLFLSWFLFVLFRKPKSWLVWTLPFVEVLWVNSHIYFFVGVCVWVTWLAGQYVQTRVITQRNIWLTFALIGATLCNPWTWHGAMYPLVVFRNYGYSIVENKSPFFLHAFGYPILTTVAICVGLAGALGYLLFSIRHWRILTSQWLLVIGLGILALLMVRNFPLFGYTLMPVLMSVACIRGSSQQTSSRALLVTGVLLLALTVSVVTNQVQAQGKFGLTVPSGAQKAVDFVREHHLKGPMFNNFDVGSFLIWKLPEEPVFIDGRPEAYPADFIRHTYIPMQESLEKWYEMADQYHIQYVFWGYKDITPWSQTFLGVIARDSEWKQVYKDGQIVIFVRASYAKELSL